MFYLLMPDLDTRTRFISHMKSRGVLTVFHYLPLNASTFGATFGGRPGQCPVTEDVSDRLVRLPLFHDMTADERAQILAAALDFNA
jgi:dTDP-4-amino-4,6-dideoxygalactose transaminase